MITDSIDSEFIRKTIPNIQFEVEGERPFSEKLAPFLKNAENQLISEYLMPGDFLNENDRYLANIFIVLAAFIDAVPSLDLVVTPTGFGVVNTETVAPASKERIERLISSLRDRADKILELLLERVRTYPEWRESERGSYFCATFLSGPKDVAVTGAVSYDTMRSEAMQVESFIARHFLGRNLMNTLRDEYNSRDAFKYLGLHDYVRNAVIQCVKARFRGDVLTINVVWHYCQPAMQILKSNPEYYDIWQKEMGKIFDHLQFKNDVKGAFYF